MKTKNTYIKDVRTGEKISETFLVIEKNLAFSQKGSAYLNLRLRDKTGEVEGKVWDRAEEWDKLFKKGDIIRIQARAVNFKNATQFSISEIKGIDYSEIDPSDYFPSATEDIDSMFSELMAFVRQIETPCLQELIHAIFQDEMIANPFKKAPAAKSLHHVYIGGLLEHTLSVTRMLDLTTGHYRGINRDLLLTGGILHDIGKIHELSYNGLFDYSDQGRLLGHIVIGVEIVDTKIATLTNFPEQLAMELRHIILSHHGTLEYGSPKRPKTLEALVIHYIDDLDAKINAFQKFIEASPDDDSDWTPFHRLFDRFLYKGK